MSPPGVPPHREDEPQNSMNFGSAVAICLRKTVRARGRASREEFWYFVLFWVATGVVAAILRDAIGAEVLGNIVGVIYMILLVPLISVSIRRLHDIGRGGEWWLLALIPILLIVLVVLWCRPGQPHPNEYGGHGDGELGGSLWG